MEREVVGAAVVPLKSSIASSQNQTVESNTGEGRGKQRRAQGVSSQGRR